MTTSDDAHGHDGAPEPPDEGGLPDDVLAALARTPEVDPEVRRRHLAVALAELDPVVSGEADRSVAPVLPFVRRRARVLQVAAAVALVVAGAALALTAGGGGSDEHADSLATAKQATTPTTAAPAPKALSPATVTPAAGGAFAGNDSAGTASSDAAARAQAPAEAATAGTADLGTFDSIPDLLRTLDGRATDQELADREPPATTCPLPADVGTPTLRASATIAGARRLVVVRRAPDGAVAAVAVLDPGTCARVG